MNTIEETLWNYIDGNCTADEQLATRLLIAGDEAVRLKYQELLRLNNEFSSMELDVPPMAFTYNVIEGIRAEEAQKPLKASINKRIIMGIAIFFIITITALLIFTLANISLSGIDTSQIGNTALKMPDLSKYFSKPLVEGFLFFDVVLALYLFDSFLRKKNMFKQA